MGTQGIENEVNTGVIENFLQQLPEQIFHLGLRIVLAALAFLIGVQLIGFLRRILKKTLTRSHIDEGAVHFIDSFVKFGLYFVLILMIASSMGVDAASILAILGSASVAVGLAIQGSLSNFAGGVLLLVLKPFVAGDYIKDGLGNEGTVDAVDIFYTQIITPENKVIVLPNGTLANGTITNYTKCSERRIDIPVGIAYEEDIQKAREVIEAAMNSGIHRSFADEPVISVQFIIPWGKREQSIDIINSHQKHEYEKYNALPSFLILPSKNYAFFLN